MSRFAILSGLLAGTVVAQAGTPTAGFNYVGCVEADPAMFNINVDFFQAFSAEECLAACGSQATYAALSSGCHCHDSMSKVDIEYDIVAEPKCSTLCIEGNETAGHCGGLPSSYSGKQTYNLYQKADDAEHDDESDEDGGTTAPVAIHNTTMAPSVATTIQTITACPTEVIDCPVATKVVACPPGGCAPTPPVNTKLPASSAEAAVSPCPKRCGAPCPPQGCASCPPEGCPPPCPPGCPMSTSKSPRCSRGSDCDSGHPTFPVCPSGECLKYATGPYTTHVRPTTGPMATGETVVISEGSHDQAGVLALVGLVALVMAISLS